MKPHSILLSAAALLAASTLALAALQPTGPSPASAHPGSQEQRFTTDLVAGRPEFVEGLAGPTPPPLPPGSPAEGPVEKDPEGHWGPAEEGVQLSLRLETNRFVLGQPVTAYVILRNCTNGFWFPSYRRSGLQGTVCNFNLWGPAQQLGTTQQEPVGARPKGPPVGFETSQWPSRVGPGRQQRSWARLDKVFGLRRPGLYVVRAVACTRLGENLAPTTAVSGPVQFEILPAAKDKPKDPAEPPKGEPKP
jgi:hypothetical protein